MLERESGEPTGAAAPAGTGERRLRVVMAGASPPTQAPGPFADCVGNSQYRSLAAFGAEMLAFGIDDTRSPRGILRNARMLGRFLVERSPDVVHALYGASTAVIAWLAARRAGVPLVVSFGGSDLLVPPQGPARGNARRKLAVSLSRFAATRTAAIIVKSRNLFGALPVAARPRARVIPNGVDLSLFRPMDRAEAREHLGLSPEGHVILFYRGGGPLAAVIKGHNLAEDAFNRLRARMSGVELLRLEGVPHAAMPAYLNSSNLVLLTSAYEGSPNIVKEAMACDVPVVSVPCGDVAERLAGVTPGSVVGRSPTELADAMEAVLRSGSRSNGRVELVRQGLSTEMVAAAVHDVYVAVKCQASRGASRP